VKSAEEASCTADCWPDLFSASREETLLCLLSHAWGSSGSDRFYLRACPMIYQTYLASSPLASFRSDDGNIRRFAAMPRSIPNLNRSSRKIATCRDSQVLVTNSLFFFLTNQARGTLLCRYSCFAFNSIIRAKRIDRFFSETRLDSQFLLREIDLPRSRSVSLTLRWNFAANAEAMTRWLRGMSSLGRFQSLIESS